MFTIDKLLLIAGLLIIFAVTSSKFASRLGMPLLVLFIGVGMLAGSDGLGGIAFDSYPLAHAIGTVALAVILFDGGLGTSYDAFRLVWKPATVMATFGVLITAGLTGLAATYVLGVPPLEGMLIGAIAGSTDAAAVFAVFRGQGLNLDERLSRTLEVESGSNDPMAIFLTVGLLQLLTHEVEPGAGLAWLFVLQMGVGSAVGLAVGKGAAALINRINLDASGLYPVLAIATGVLAYGLAATFGGSGFLAVYLAGVVLGNSQLVFKRGIFIFHDGMAWLSQITMFVVLGLLSFPSRLADTAPSGLLVAAALVFVARPVATFGLLWPFGFGWRELLFISWAGLKGAVPVILGTYPFLFGLPDGSKIFDVVFFVVLISAILQGSTLGWFARRLGLIRAARVSPPASLEITSIRDIDGDIVGYPVAPDSQLAGRVVRELWLPDGALVALISRDHRVIPPRGSTQISAGDHLFVVVHTELRPVIDRLFAGSGPGSIPPRGLELQAGARLADLAALYGIDVRLAAAGGGGATLASLVRDGLGDEPVEVGAAMTCGDLRVEVTEIREGVIKRVRVTATSEQRAPAT